MSEKPMAPQMAPESKAPPGVASQDTLAQDTLAQDTLAQDAPPQDALSQDTAPAELPLPDAATVAAYESTNYFAHEAEPVLLRIGDPPSSHRDWLDKMNARSATILTAWNPRGVEKPREENDRAQGRLLSAIHDRDLRWVAASGEDPAGTWQPEPGFCVFDVPDDVLDEWLVTFMQNAAVQATLEEPCRLVWHPSIRSR